MTRFATCLLGEAETLLLATDGSHYSDGAVQEALFFAQSCAARVVVLHVVKVRAESQKSADGRVRLMRQEVEPYLDEVRRMASDAGVTLEVVVVGASRPEEAIIEQARLRRADVILMGRHGAAGRLSLLVGRRTSRVLELGFPKVLVVPRNFIISGARVLLVVDERAGTEKAVLEAIGLGRKNATLQELTVVAVAKKERRLARLAALAEEARLRIAGSGSDATCEVLTLLGDPVAEIVATARQRNCDMILIAGCGRRCLTGLFFGRTTRQVAGRAHCAVLVVNP